jgi:acyl-homoserine-lactone acylase
MSLAALAPVEPARARSEPAPTVDIRRTADGIPHIRAGSWHHLGFGQGYAQGQDALCTLAESFVTYRGQRSLHFGPEGRPGPRSTFGTPANVDLDFFFKAFADDTAVEALRREQPEALNALIAGFADGYNRYLGTLRQPRAGRTSKAVASSRPACTDAAWVQPIGPDDIYRRMIAAGLAGGYTQFVTEIVRAQPAPAVPSVPPDNLSLSSRLAIPVGDAPGIGSNVLAFGGAATGGQGGVLFGNPHWYWGGADRFYQSHLTLPGKLDVAGVAFLGIPVVMIGFNNDVAWSHTVSAARRFGFFDLTLDPADPTRYLVDGLSQPMQALPLAVEVRGADGTVDTVRRTLYRTRFGPMIDLGAHHPALGWSAQKAVAIRDINADNHRIFRNFFRWNQARSLDEFIALQREEAAMPWVNTAAIGRTGNRPDNRAWYADIGAVPNAPDDLRATCATPLSKAFVAFDPTTPVLDGSRSACEWKNDAAAVQKGSVPAASMPELLREDYVANMNNSHWLANPAQPLTGFAANFGGEGQEISLRAREGLRIAGELANAGETSARGLARRVARATLEARAYSADRFKTPLLEGACKAESVTLSAEDPAPSLGSTSTAPTALRVVDVRPACEVLGRWSNRAGAQDRGALLWDFFWARVQRIPAAELYAAPFSAQSPLSTPGDIRGRDPRVARALAGAVEDMAVRGWALDTPLGAQRFARSQGRVVPLYGGCDAEGYFTVACPRDGDYIMRETSHGNTYLQIVYFDARGVQALTMLAHGERETAVTNGLGRSSVARYGRKDWLSFPFREEDIKRDPSLHRQVLVP